MARDYINQLPCGCIAALPWDAMHQAFLEEGYTEYEAYKLAFMLARISEEDKEGCVNPWLHREAS